MKNHFRTNMSSRKRSISEIRGAKIIAKVTKDQKDSMRGTEHPDPSIQQSETRQVYNSHDYQYMDYIKALATASKLNL